jgi:DNA polymerase-3 subunit delta'|tara:strand:+ start:176 stop:1105 length:930 start_codon:yes stop_codon:yes gene_type:complete
VTTQIAEQSPSQLIDRAIRDNRLAHALLIHGQNLKQVESFAYELTSKLIEVSQTDDGVEWHPDVFSVRPSKKSRVISVDDTRELIRNIQHSPQKGDRKVALIYEVDRLNASAANAFLKTLEEPPLNTTILLLTTRPYSLLATIRSRCQLFRLPTSNQSLADPRALEWLRRYREWLSDLLHARPGGKGTIPHYIMGLYGLIEQFRHIIEAITKETWKEQSQNLPEELGDGERIALESRISISLRQDFLAAIEVTTEAFARDSLTEKPNVPSKLIDCIRALESSPRLLNLNMKPEAALEAFMLHTLRIWAA